MTLKTYNQYIKELLPQLRPVSVFDKDKNISCMNIYDLVRLQSLFEYKNLPSTIPARYLEMYLQMAGHVCIAQVDGALYALVGSYGGEPDAYYLPLDYVVANPYLKLSRTFKRDVDCVVIQNDPMLIGVLPLLSKYNQQLAENEISLNLALINARIISLITASTDPEKEAADHFIQDIIDGKLTSVMQNPFFEGIKAQPYATSGQANHLTDLIETEQYLKAGKLNDLGLNANYNMKRESLNSNESQLNDDMLLPFVDQMLKMRKEGIEKVNNMFGTDIEVDFASAWKENKIEHDVELLQMLEAVKGSDPDPEAADPEAADPEAADPEAADPGADPEAEPEDEQINDIKDKITDELLDLVDPEPEQTKEDMEDDNNANG